MKQTAHVDLLKPIFETWRKQKKDDEKLFKELKGSIKHLQYVRESISLKKL